MDDRTGSSFLSEIQSRHPGVVILELKRTPKRKKGRRDEPIFITGWREAISQYSGDYFLLLEDDQWLTKSLDLEKVAKWMGESGVIVTSIFDNPNIFDNPKPKIQLFADNSTLDFFRYQSAAVVESHSSFLRFWAYRAFLSRSKLLWGGFALREFKVAQGLLLVVGRIFKPYRRGSVSQRLVVGALV
jgi:hypothetical protein